LVYISAKDCDKTATPSAYDAGRGYSPEVLAFWLDVIARAVAGGKISRILDLGCGTGRFSARLAQRFDADVIAVDPSQSMLAEARKKAAPRVLYERASGEALPLAGGSVDVVFPSMVFHHFADSARVAAECRRVLRDGGAVFLRAACAEAIESYPITSFFPESRPILHKTLPTRAAMQAVFAGAGLRCNHHEIAPSKAAANWSLFAEKVSHRADSILIQLSDEEFAAGMAALRAQAADAAGAVIEPADIFVFRRDHHSPGTSR
jgi:ubiquinone/menaquinone biosynthesis C-methylase UbiE